MSTQVHQETIAAGGDAPAQLAQVFGVLTLLLRYNGLAVSREGLGHEFAGLDRIGCDEVVRSARRQGLKARQTVSGYARLAINHLPAYAGRLDGEAMIVAKIDGDHVTIHRGESHRPELMDRLAFEPARSVGIITVRRKF